MANLRTMVLLWKRFRLSLTLFAAVIGLGSLLMWLGYTYPQTGGRLSYPEALYAVFSMLFFESVVPLPHGALQIIFFVVPILGLSIVAEGIIRFNVLLLDKNNPSGEWTVALASTYSGHIIVCGLGHVGYRVVQQLLSFGQEVIAVEKNPQADFAGSVQESGVLVIQGDASKLDVLDKAGVERAQAIVLATNDAMMNLSIALDACELNPDIRVVLRMFDADLAKKIEQGFGIRVALSASAIAAPAFATAALREGVTHSFFLEGDLLNVSEVIIHPQGKLVGQSVQEAEEGLDFTIVFHQRGETRDMHPPARMCLKAGDKLVVVATLEQLNQLEQLNCPPKGSRSKATRPGKRR
jgi:Trk K+ transport system NAD-binding subunit